MISPETPQQFCAPPAPAHSSVRDCAAVVLAAGLGQRMGGQNKLLRPLHQRPVLQWTLATLAPLQLDEVWLITGRDAPKVRALANSCDLPLRCRHNPRFSDGMGSSLACGMRALSSHIRACFVVLGDMPAVGVETYRQLYEQLQQRQALAARAHHAQRAGHPVLFSQPLFAELRQLKGDQGAKALLQSLGDQFVPVAVDDPHCLSDVDSPHALAELEQCWHPPTLPCDDGGETKLKGPKHAV